MGGEEDALSPRQLRTPLTYSSINREQYDTETARSVGRYKYYSRLAPKELLMPDHVVPRIFYLTLPVQPQGKQGSLITIFSIWNTMMGTSILSMPWAIEQAGFANGIVILVLMAGITLYTAALILNSVHGLESTGEVMEFSDVCRHYLGRWGEYCSVFFSISALLGATIVYWVLMSNFLFHAVTFIYQQVSTQGHNNSLTPASINMSYAICPSASNSSSLHALLQGDSIVDDEESTFTKVWNMQNTVPFFLIALVLPLINFKSPTFFTKFNALGTISVAYLTTFVCVKAGNWGIHVDFNNTESVEYIPEFNSHFPALSGTLALAYFIHNAVLSITRNQKHPENNTRDLSIAYFLVMATYMFVGILFYISYPLAKSCIEDNLLNNLDNLDPMSFAARIGLLFQMITVFPLLMFIFRIQFMHTIFGSIFPSRIHVVCMNLGVIAICLVFAVFYPSIGSVIRFSGAFCGMAYIFALPCIVHMLKLRQEGKLTMLSGIFHGTLIFIGVANFVAQFIIL